MNNYLPLYRPSIWTKHWKAFLVSSFEVSFKQPGNFSRISFKVSGRYGDHYRKFSICLLYFNVCNVRLDDAHHYDLSSTVEQYS